MKTRSLILILILIVFFRAESTPVLFSLQALTGNANNHAIVVTPDPVTPATFGTNLLSLQPITLQPIGGVVVTNLLSWGYTVRVDGWPSSVHIIVPTDTNTWSVVALINTNVFFSTNIYIGGTGFSLGSSVPGSNGTSAVMMIGLDAFGKSTTNAVPAGGANPSSNNFVGSLNIGQIYGGIIGATATNSFDTILAAQKATNNLPTGAFSTPGTVATLSSNTVIGMAGAAVSASNYLVGVTAGGGSTNLTGVNAAGAQVVIPWSGLPSGGGSTPNTLQTNAQGMVLSQFGATNPANVFYGSFTTNGYNAVNLGPTNAGAIVEAYPGAVPWELVQRAYVPSLPVPTFRPLNAGVIALDLMPNGSPTDTGYGVTWFDMCSQDCITNNPTHVQTIHFATHTNFEEISTVDYVGGQPLPLEFGASPGGYIMMTLNPSNLGMGIGITNPDYSFEDYSASGNTIAQIVNANTNGSAYAQLGLKQSTNLTSGGRIFLFNNNYAGSGGKNNSMFSLDAYTDVTNAMTFVAESPTASFGWYLAGGAVGNQVMSLSPGGVASIIGSLAVGTTNQPEAGFEVYSGGLSTGVDIVNTNVANYTRLNLEQSTNANTGGALYTMNNSFSPVGSFFYPSSFGVGANSDLTNGLGLAAMAPAGTIKFFAGGYGPAQQVMTLTPAGAASMSGTLAIGRTNGDYNLDVYSASGNTISEIVNANTNASAYARLSLMTSTNPANGARIFMFNNNYAGSGGKNNSMFALDAYTDVTNQFSFLVESTTASFGWYLGGQANANEVMALSPSGVLTVSNSVATASVTASGNITSSTGTIVANTFWIETKAQFGAGSDEYINVGSDQLTLGTSAGAATGTLVVSNLLLNGAAKITNGLTLAGGPTGTNWITFANTAARTNANFPPTISTTAYIFAATNSSLTAELYTMDGAGTVKQFSEHAIPDAPPSIVDTNDPFPNISMERNDYFGIVRWINRSREALIANLTLKVNANSYEAWLGIQAGTNISLLQNNATWANYRTNWATSAMGANWYSAMKQFVQLNAGNLTVTTNETYAAYNARLGLATNSPGYLTPHTWGGDQAAMQAAYALSFTNAMEVYSAATNAFAQIDPVDPDTNDIAPVWSPPASNAIPSWMAARGVQ